MKNLYLNGNKIGDKKTFSRCVWFVIPGFLAMTGLMAVDYLDRLAYGQETKLKEPTFETKVEAKKVDVKTDVKVDVKVEAKKVDIAVEPKVVAPVAAAAPVVVVPSEPTTPEEALSAAKQGFEFAKAKNWLGLSAICIFLIMFGLKTLKVFEKIGKRWAYILSPALSLVAMLLANLSGNVSWNTVWIVLASGPAGAVLNDLWKRGILGQEPSTPMVPVKADKAAGSVVASGTVTTPTSTASTTPEPIKLDPKG
jgi:hypothetical protein